MAGKTYTHLRISVLVYLNIYSYWCIQYTSHVVGYQYLTSVLALLVNTFHVIISLLLFHPHHLVLSTIVLRDI